MKMTLRQMTIVTFIVALIILAGNWVGFHNPVIESIPGMLLLMAMVGLGVLANRCVWKKLPSVAYIVTIACIVTVPGFPGAAWISEKVKHVHFLALCTPILAYVGISIGKDLGMLKKTGWKIIVVGFTVFIGTFLGSAVIAELVLRATGQV